MTKTIQCPFSYEHVQAAMNWLGISSNLFQHPHCYKALTATGNGTIYLPPSKRIKSAGGIGQQVKGTGFMPDRSSLVEFKPTHLSKNAKRKAARYRDCQKTVGQAIGTSKARQVCRERYKARLKAEALPLPRVNKQPIFYHQIEKPAALVNLPFCLVEFPEREDTAEKVGHYLVKQEKQSWLLEAARLRQRKGWGQHLASVAEQIAKKIY